MRVHRIDVGRRFDQFGAAIEDVSVRPDTRQREDFCASWQPLLHAPVFRRQAGDKAAHGCGLIGGHAFRR